MIIIKGERNKTRRQESRNRKKKEKKRGTENLGNLIEFIYNNDNDNCSLNNNYNNDNPLTSKNNLCLFVSSTCMNVVFVSL